MNIQLFSDLHLEFERYEASFQNADVLVFAGDIEIGVKGIKWLENLATDKPIIYVLGNHEYYINTYPKLINKIKGEITKNNIFVFENKSVLLDSINFHGCTLWTDFEIFGDPKIAGYHC